MVAAGMRNEMDDPKAHTDGIELSESIDDLIEAILAEEEDENPKENRGDAKKKNEEMKDKKDEEMKNEDNCKTKNEELKETLGEAYDTVSHLKSVINEVNLLNAKLLYTNKLFRNFDLNEGQKMKVIENFDRAGNTREAKLVFATLAESFHKPKRGKKIVKESKSMASKPVASTAPSKETTQVLTEGFEQANRWKKLAGLIK
jgi:predicted RNase H-like nuclease (RuvC/YqgF family)